MPPRKPAKTPPKTYGKPEPVNWKGRLMAWAFLLCAIGGIYWMATHSVKEKPLVCKTTGAIPSLSQFGTCVTE